MTDNGNSKTTELSDKMLINMPEEIAVIEAHGILQGNAAITLIDVRERGASLGYISGALIIPINLLEKQSDRLPADKDSPIITYCGSTILSKQANTTLKKLGYTNVHFIRGGFNAWQALGFDVASDSRFTSEQLTRYSRNILLDEIGIEGQVKLLNSKVLIVGAGGLGCPAALYLAAAGVGTIGIADFDMLDLSNLNRQVLHGTADVGRLKIDSAKDALYRLNPGINIVTYEERFTARNCLDIIKEYDVVMDATDSIKTKFLLNDACFFAGKPYVFGGATKFDGQASVFFPNGGGPCLRCMFPRPPSERAAPTCSEIGVLGVVPGQIGLVQAAEILKLILGIGKTLIGRLLIYGSLNTYFETINFERNPSCPLCGNEPAIKTLAVDSKEYIDDVCEI